MADHLSSVRVALGDCKLAPRAPARQARYLINSARVVPCMHADVHAPLMVRAGRGVLTEWEVTVKQFQESTKGPYGAGPGVGSGGRGGGEGMQPRVEVHTAAMCRVVHAVAEVTRNRTSALAGWEHPMSIPAS